MSSPSSDLKALFQLDPEITFLNHGSFGACPIPVFQVYQDWQRKLERQPVEFLGRQAPALLHEARAYLADYLGVQTDEVVYMSNPTTAANMVVRSLDLQPGDEILATDQEYGAMVRIWHFICQQTGARYVSLPIPLPVSTPEQFVEYFWQAVTPRTRVVFISHITSPTGLIFPVAALCQRAKQAGLISIVDGAHAPGQIELDLKRIGADIYIGACHKWLCAPKGSAFLYAHPMIQPRLNPLVVSWGYESEKPSNSQFIDYHEWQGTRDLAAFLSVPAAIRFQAEHDWSAVRLRCHALASEMRQRIERLTSLESICPDTPAWFGQMFSTRLPAGTAVDQLKAILYDEFQIEIPVISWEGQPMLRVSIQGYNDTLDTERLLAALSSLLFS
jgi:isopenicillin-N epimerase